MKPSISSAAAATLLSLCGLARGADISSVMICTSNIYADGAIYRNTSAAGAISTSLEGFPAKQAFPLYFAVTSHSSAPLDPIRPAQITGTHQYTVLDEYLYINASSGAFAPVGFVQGGNSTLGAGETTWGFYSPYGFLLWYNPSFAASSGSQRRAAPVAVHIQGFQWVPVEGFTTVTRLYWNQTQYGIAAALGSSSGIDAATASFGNCQGDPEATVSPA